MRLVEGIHRASASESLRVQMVVVACCDALTSVNVLYKRR